MGDHPFIKAISERVLVSDGAKGTLLQESGLPPGACPDAWNLERYDVVRGIHKEYAASGAEVLVTNTFNSLPVKLAQHGLQDRLGEIVKAGIEAARAGAGDAGASRYFLAGSIPPTGRFIRPVGDMGFDEAVAQYRVLASALARAGADVFWLETFTDIMEIKAAMVAIREVSDLPVVAMMTFDSTCRTVLGTPPQVAAICLEKLGACAVGANCSLGPSGILDCLRSMREVTDLPFVSQPNAGLPGLKEGRTVYSESPGAMAAHVGDLIGAGVRLIGGCCGTTPAHIKANAEAVGKAVPQRMEVLRPTRFTKMFLASRTRVAVCGPGEPLLVIGERINPTGRRKFGEKLLAGSMETVVSEARGQKEAGAGALDVNVGVPGGDEPSLMEAAVRAAQSAADLPVVIDSSNIAALEAGLKAAAGRPLVNSVNGEQPRLDAVLALSAKYGAAVVALCLDDKGVPEDKAARLAIADRIGSRAAEHGLGPDDVIYDFLTLSVASGPDQVSQTLDAVSEAAASGRLTVLGTSNVSYGLPARDSVNSAFTSMAVKAGLDAVIMNPAHAEMTRSLAAAALLAGRDPSAQRYLSLFKASGSRVLDSKAAKRTDIASRMGAAVMEGDPVEVVRLVEEALGMGMAPLQISSKGLMPGMAEVGRLFRQNEMFLPQVMLSAEAMQAAMGRLEKELGAKDAKDSPLILLATVEGDIHDLGKGIVAALLRNSGFRVHDAGKGVPAAKIVELATELHPACVGLSALMTTTMVRMREVITDLRAAGHNIPVMVGGAVLNEEYAASIHAHYGADAVAAVELAKKLCG
jgi:5-methyltetrahydrofolate--homocysteine methyltransferase